MVSLTYNLKYVGSKYNNLMLTHQIILQSKYFFTLGKYHLLPPGGGLLEFGGTHNFWRQKGGNTKFFPPNRGEQKIFIKKF